MALSICKPENHKMRVYISPRIVMTEIDDQPTEMRQGFFMCDNCNYKIEGVLFHKDIKIDPNSESYGRHPDHDAAE